MQELEASTLLEIVSTGTSHSMLARRWQSAHLVNLNADVLRSVLSNAQLMEKIESVEAFRGIGKQAEGIIAREDRLNKAKRESTISKKDAKAEKDEINKERKTIRDKLLKFLTRIPAFMYLTDKREATLEDVIMGDIEPNLFKRVTGLDKEDFAMLKDAGVFDPKIMDEAIWAFRKFEEASLGYAGNAHLSDKVGGFSSVTDRSKL